MTIWIILAFSGVALIGAISAKFLGKDNVVEQIAENVIEEGTGIDMDLSPESTDPNVLQRASTKKTAAKKSEPKEKRSQLAPKNGDL